MLVKIAFTISVYLMLSGRVINDCERIWKGMVMP